MTNRKWHMDFPLTPRSMTLKVWIFSEFLGISQISDAITAKRMIGMKIGQYCQRQRCKHAELEQFLACLCIARVVSDSWVFLYGPPCTPYTSFPVPTCQFCFQKRSYCLIIVHKQFNDLCLYSLAIPEVSCAITLPDLRRVVMFSSPYSNHIIISQQY